MKLYPVAQDSWRHVVGFKGIQLKEVRAQKTGECRPPKAGEWFLSGAEVEAYYAYADLLTPYHIVKLVQVVTSTIETVVGEVETRTYPRYT